MTVYVNSMIFKFASNFATVLPGGEPGWSCYVNYGVFAIVNLAIRILTASRPCTGMSSAGGHLRDHRDRNLEMKFVVLRSFVPRGIRRLSTGAKGSIPRVPLLINGKFVESKSEVWYDVANPATQEVLAQVPQATSAEMNAAVAAAKEAFGTWRYVTPSERQRVLFRYQHAIRENIDDIAALITKEQGKTLGDAKGDVFRGLEVVEFACGAASRLMGETLESVGNGIDTYSYRQPLGVCAGIAPFNFPAMIPLWMYPLACVLGNTYVLKPSERVPLTSVRLMELAVQSGFPPGTVNLIHGAHDTVNFICDHPDIRAISFVGSNAAGEHIYKSAPPRSPPAARRHRRTLCTIGADRMRYTPPDHLLLPERRTAPLHQGGGPAAPARTRPRQNPPPPFRARALLVQGRLSRR